MAQMIAEVYRPFRTADVPEDQAEATAKAVADTDRSIGDLRSEFGSLRVEFAGLRSEFNELKSDVRLLKWMMGFLLGINVLILGKLLFPG